MKDTVGSPHESPVSHARAVSAVPKVVMEWKEIPFSHFVKAKVQELSMELRGIDSDDLFSGINHGKL